jgi:hypothetical protein
MLDPKKVRSAAERRVEAGKSAPESAKTPATDPEKLKRVEAFRQRMREAKAKRDAEAKDPKPVSAEEKARRVQALNARRLAQRNAGSKTRLERVREGLELIKAQKAEAAKKVKAVEVDENGTPIVGGAPNPADPALNPAPKVDPNATPAPVDGAAPATPPAVEVPEAGKTELPTDTEEVASALVQVNEKLSEIGKRAEVDKVVKTELEAIKETLTSTTAAVRKLTAKKVVAKADKLTKEEQIKVVAFLAKVDEVYQKQMTGFETKASVKDDAGFAGIISNLRIGVDVANEKAHSTLDSYIKNTASAKDVRDAVRLVKAAVEKWGVAEQMTDFFKKEARVSSGSTDHVRTVVAHVQEMVTAGAIDAADIGSQVDEYLELSPKEFKAVASTMNRVQTRGTDGETPRQVIATQTGVRGGQETLEDCFEDS